MKGRFTEHALDAQHAAPFLRSIMPIGDGSDPIAVTGWRQFNGQIRRVRADYADGWRLTFTISAGGVVSRVRVIGRFVVAGRFES